MSFAKQLVVCVDNEGDARMEDNPARL